MAYRRASCIGSTQSQGPEITAYFHDCALHGMIIIMRCSAEKCSITSNIVQPQYLRGRPRCFCQPQNDIGWHPYMESWVQARPVESEKVVLEGANPDWVCGASLQISTISSDIAHIVVRIAGVVVTNWISLSGTRTPEDGFMPYPRGPLGTPIAKNSNTANLPPRYVKITPWIS